MDPDEAIAARNTACTKLIGVAGQAVDAATKTASKVLCRTWAKELGQSHGVTVNSVNPDPLPTVTRSIWIPTEQHEIVKFSGRPMVPG